jgi:hypothetical protein
MTSFNALPVPLIVPARQPDAGDTFLMWMT